MILLLALGCVDYGINVLDKGDTPFDTAGIYDPSTEITDAGLACADEWETLATETSVDESCARTPITGALQTRVLWSRNGYDNYRAYPQALVVPIVGRLTDDNGDGVIDGEDPPDIAVVTDDGVLDAQETHGVLRVLDGESGAELAAIFRVDTETQQVYPYRYSSIAAGDIDNDGFPEIVGIAEVLASSSGGPDEPGGGGDPPPDDPTDPGGGGGGGGEEPPPDIPVSPGPPADTGATPSCRVVAWRVDGTVAWVANDAPRSCVGDVPSLADLEGDGAVEVLVGSLVLNGADGSVRSEGADGQGRYLAFSQIGAISFAIDLDGDGVQEIIAGNTIYDADGSQRCQTGKDDGFPAAADLDMDGVGEVVTVGNGMVRIVRDDCSMVDEWTLDGAENGGPPTIADFDGDGVPEIGAASATAYSVYEADGTRLWSATITDAISFTSGSSVFDFDGDGRAEVVFADETTLWVFDGATGAVRIEDGRHSSRTLHEYPVVADVDDDGRAEIVVPNGGGHYDDAVTGMYVLESADEDGWLGGRVVWNQHAYNITNVDDDLHIPAVPASNWPDHNNFRSGDVNPVSGGDWADASPIVSVCTQACEVAAQLVVGVRVQNPGTAALAAGLPVALYVGTLDAPWAVLRTSEIIPPGGTSAVLAFTVDAAAAASGMQVIVDDLGGGVETLIECHEDNNVSWPFGTCL